jgi:hypothetical protein
LIGISVGQYAVPKYKKENEFVCVPNLLSVAEPRYVAEGRRPEKTQLKTEKGSAQ